MKKVIPKNIEAMSTIVAPDADPKKYDKISPATPETRAIATEYRWYCLILLEIFLAAAAGRTSIELIIRTPTH